MKKKNIFIVLLIIGLLLIPYDSFAIVKKGKGEGSNDGTITDSSVPEATSGNLNYACMDYYMGMKISVSKYKRKANYANGVYTNNVSPRTITFSNNTGKSYKVIIYHGPIGSLDDLKNLSDEEIKKYNDDADEDDETTEEDTIRVKKKTMKSNKSWSWSLRAGEEALAIYLNNSKKTVVDANNNPMYYRGSCASTDKDGNCTSWYKVIIKCPKGKLNANKSTAEEPVITGNSISLFVENPFNTGKVPNIKKSSTACNNARNGIYDGESADKELYNVKNDQKTTWTTDYYNKLLSYCDENSVDFNLNEKDIRELSNGLLKVFYYNNRINELKEDGTIKDLTTINNIATEWKQWIKEKYKKLGLSSSGHIIEGNDKDLTTSLQCRYDKNSIMNSDGKSLDEDYLYITDVKTEKADITKTNVGTGRKTRSIDVCSTKCYEHLTVKYDVPKTVKAGLCFSYKVTVKSESECGIEVKDYWKELNKPDTCAPVAICENDDVHTQAGPNEEFDSCINECDGGKYSQSCINSCYNKVYKGKKKSETSTAKTTSDVKEYQVSNLVVSSFGDTALKRLANQKYTEAELKNYYSSSHAKAECRTTAKIKTNIDECAEYFFEAKSLYPYGTYECYSSNCEPNYAQGGGNLKWVSSVNSTSGMNKDWNEGTSIPEQIGRAAPFYVRDVPSTKELLKALIGYKNSSNVWYKYVINNHGFKQQYSARWVCNEKCSFTGCHQKKNANDDEGDVSSENIAYTSGEYSNNLKLDLDAIQEALSKCNATTACDKKESTTEYEINITSDGAGGQGGSVGTTTLGSTNGEASFINGNKTESMFTSEEIDEFGVSTDPTTETGILGLCYDDRKNPHYQTTITYPGTYINYKTGARKFVDTVDDTYYFKNKYFCTPYDDKDVNKDYAYWSIINKYDPDTYPTNFTPEKYNIEAKLGKTNKGFGKYNWKVNFSCFYSSMTDLVTTCTPGEPDCPTGTCSKSDPNYPICSPPIETNCSNGEHCECSSTGSSRLCNVNFRVVDSTNLFPDPKQSDGKKVEQELPFNWTSKAQDKDTSTTYGQVLETRGYMVNPTEYRKKIEDTANGNSEYYYSGIPMYHIKLSRENIKALKNYVKTHKYNSYEGEFTKVDNTDMRYYNVSDNVKEYIDYFDNSNAHLGYNNK